jgi:hypothetical protein
MKLHHRIVRNQGGTISLRRLTLVRYTVACMEAALKCVLIANAPMHSDLLLDYAFITTYQSAMKPSVEPILDRSLLYPSRLSMSQ